MGSGNCMFWAPDTFDLSEDGHAVVTDPAPPEEKIRIAAQGCPVGAISLWRNGTSRCRSRKAPDADRRHRGARVPPPPRSAGSRRTARRPSRALAEAVPTPASVPPSPSCRPCGRRWRPRVGSGCTCPRRTAARGSRWPRWPSWSRSSAPRCFPGPLLPTLLVSAALARHADAAVRRRAPARPGRRLRHRRRRLRRDPWRERVAGDGTLVLRGPTPPRPRPAGGPARPRAAASTARPSGACSIGRASATGRSALEPLPALDPTRPSARCDSPAASSSCPADEQVLLPDDDGAQPRVRAQRPPRARAWRAGASTRRRTTPRCACSSAGPSASSRR